MRAPEHQTDIPFCSLLELRPGSRAIVRGYGSDVPSGLARRLVSMGLPIGMEAEILVKRGRGPVLLRARESRIALGRDEARGIQVERIEAGGARARRA